MGNYISTSILDCYGGMIVHSDRGSQFTSYAFRDILTKKGDSQSTSDTVRCYNNARMESFFTTLKKESLYQIKTLELKMAKVKSVIFCFIITIIYAECIRPMLAILLPYFAIDFMKKLRLLRVFLVYMTKPLLTIPF